MGSGLPREVSQGPRGVLSHEELRQDPCPMLPGYWGRNLGSVCLAAGGLRTFLPAAQDSAGDSSAVEAKWVGVWWDWPRGGLSHPAARRALHLPHVPQAAPAGLGRAPVGRRHLEPVRKGQAHRPARASPGEDPGSPYPRSLPPSNPSHRLPGPPPPTYWSEGSQLPSTKPSATCGDTGEPGPGRAERRPALRCRSRAPRDPPAAAVRVAATAGARGQPAPGRTCSAATEVASPEARRLYEGHAPGPLPAQTPSSRDYVNWRIGLVATPRSPPQPSPQDQRRLLEAPPPTGRPLATSGPRPRNSRPMVRPIDVSLA